MKYDFALLRFAEDKNISDRGYWYLSGFPVAAGERVLAPVGMHDRLQCAVVERSLSAAAEDAPYDVRLIKRIAAKYGARRIAAGETELVEFGGIRYDEKHFTRFRKIVFCEALPSDLSAIFAYGVTKTLQMSADDPALYEEIARANGCVLLVGEEGKRAAKRLVFFVRGQDDLSALGIPEETARLLEEKLR